MLPTEITLALRAARDFLEAATGTAKSLTTTLQEIERYYRRRNAS